MYYFTRSIKILEKEGIKGLSKRVFHKLMGRSAYPDQNKLYENWLNQIEKPYLENESQKGKPFDSARKTSLAQGKQPKISILMPVYNVDPKILEEAIESVKAQWYPNWELCLYDDCSTNLATVDYLKKLNTQSSKLKALELQFGEVNLNISGATNKAYEMSSGDYLMLMDNDDMLRPNALYEIVKAINEHDNLDLIYFDEDKLDKFGSRIEPWFKPDFSPELMWSMMYPTHAVYSRKIFEKAGKMRIGFEGSQDYDLALRVMELTDKIHHIPWVLYNWRKVEGSTAENISGKSYAITSAKQALKEAMKRRGFEGEIQNDFYPFIPVFKMQSNPTVEIIIPIKDKIKLLQNCLESIWEKTTYSNYSITVINNNSQEEKTLKYLESIKKKVQVLDYPKEYNFSAINNFAVSKSTADYVLFLNNDTKIITENWLEGLLMWASQKEIGAVGAKLLYPDHTVQHAGILVGVGGVANHAYYRQPEENNFYFNHLHCVRNYLAVTGACMMVSREKFNKVGGFEEKLPLAFNDVDLGLKLHEKGLRNVYTPYVELIHFESKSRDPKVTKNEDQFMHDKWDKYIKNDPYYNPNLTRDISSKPPFSL